MCFSANVSFAASIVLVVTGVALFKRGFKPQYRFIAIYPFVFALQQFIEGMVWLEQNTANFPFYAYLVIAFCFWPIWIPFSLLEMEKAVKISGRHFVFLGMGLVTALMYLSLIPFVELEICSSSLHYLIKNIFPELSIFILGSCYFLSTTLPFLFSFDFRMKLFGFLLALTGIISHLVDIYWTISLWCFAAAILSISLFCLIPQKKSGT